MDTRNFRLVLQWLEHKINGGMIETKNYNNKFVCIAANEAKIIRGAINTYLCLTKNKFLVKASACKEDKSLAYITIWK